MFKVSGMGAKIDQMQIKTLIARQKYIRA